MKAKKKSNIKDVVYDWGQELGRREAEKRLCLADISYSLAYKLLSQIYTGSIKRETEIKLLKAMKMK